MDPIMDPIMDPVMGLDLCGDLSGNVLLSGLRVNREVNGKVCPVFVGLKFRAR